MKKNKFSFYVIFCSIFFFYFPVSAQASLEKMEKDLPFGETLIVYFVDVKRFLNTTPGIIAVQRLEDDAIEVSTNNIGKGILIVWTKDGKFMMKVNVARPVPPPSRSSILNDFSKKSKDYFVFSAEMYNDFFDSTKDQNVNKRNQLFGEYRLVGPTQIGEAGIYTQIKNDWELNNIDIDLIKLYLNNGKIGPIKNFDLELIDFTQDGAGNLLPSLRLRGIRVGNSRDLKIGGLIPEEYKIFYGSLRGRSLYSGISLFPVTDEEDKNISGVRVIYKRKPFIPWINKKVKMQNLFLYRHTEVSDSDSSNINENSLLFQHKTQLKRNSFKFSVLDFDVLSSLEFSLFGGKNKWVYGVDFRSIPHLEGDYPQTGKRDATFSLEYYPELKSKYFELDVLTGEVGLRSDYISDDITEGYSDPAYSYIFRTRAKAYKIKVRMKYSIKDYTNLLVANQQKEWNIYLNRSFELWRKITAFANYNQREIENEVRTSFDRTTNSFNWGASFFLVDRLRMYYSNSKSITDGSSGERLTQNDIQTIGTSFSHRLRSNLTLLATISASSLSFESFSSNNTIDKRKNISLSTGLNYFFKAFPGNAYVRTDVKKFNEDDEDYYEYNIKTGLNFRFAAFPGLLPKCSIEGIVFKDKNGNGIHDEGEEFLKDKRIMISGGKYEIKTDEFGYYKFEKISGLQTNVSLNMADIPGGYIVTTISNYKMDIKNGETYQCNFGIAISNQIWGRVFSDLNDNGSFDPGIDNVFHNVGLSLQNKMTAKTDLKGFYNFISLPKGEYILNLDYSTLPLRHYSKEKLRRTVLVEEGKVIQVDFPFMPERTVMGTVFYDKDNNGVFSKEDKPLKDIIVECAGIQAKTTKKGKFVLKKLPAGKHRITIEDDSIPEGMSLSEEFPEVDIVNEPVTIRNIYFPVIMSDQ